MNLTDFDNWHKLKTIAINNLPIKDKAGFIYVFRNMNSKEILYIGSTSSLLRRIFGNYLGGVGGDTTQRIHALLFDEGAIEYTEFAWLSTLEYKSEEKYLRQSYMAIYNKLPPWNRQI